MIASSYKRATKGTVILNISDYTERMHELLADTTKFRSLKIIGGKDYNYIINQESGITAVLPGLMKKGAMTAERYEELRPVGTQPSVL